MNSLTDHFLIFFIFLIFFQPNDVICVTLSVYQEDCLEKTQMEDMSCQWMQIKQGGSNIPSKRFDFGFVPINSTHLLLFGGKDEQFQVRNDTNLFNSLSETWSLINTRESPDSRADHFMQMVEDGAIYLHGGKNNQVLGDLWKFENWTWTRQNTSQNVHLWGHFGSSQKSDGSIFIFGGSNETTYLNQLWKINTENGMTQLLSGNASDLPPARMWHSISPLEISLVDGFYVFGGINSLGPLNDMWKYELGQNSWRELQPGGDIPSPRSGHSVSFHPKSKQIFLFGGENAEQMGTNDLYIYSIEQNHWKQMIIPNAPPPRLGHKTVMLENDMYVFGGVSGWVENTTILNDMWKLHCDFQTSLSSQSMKQNMLLLVFCMSLPLWFFHF